MSNYSPMCDRCQSEVAVKANKHCAGHGSGHEYLCRACRFDVSNIRRSRETQRYVIYYHSAANKPSHQASHSVDAQCARELCCPRSFMS